MLASALIKQILVFRDFDTWVKVRKKYLPTELHSIYSIITKHVENYGNLPTFEELKFGIRDSLTLEKVAAIESQEVDSEPYLLLDYVRNEFAQYFSFGEIERFVENSAAFETAEELIRSIQSIAVRIETEVELDEGEYSMQTIELFDSDEEIEAKITLGFNSDFDNQYQFRSNDYIMIGGMRGSGKSLVCNNIARHVINDKQLGVLYFSTEMVPRQVLQRDCSIATGVPLKSIVKKELSVTEWGKVATYWASRFKDSDGVLKRYFQHNSFDKFQKELAKLELRDDILDVVYDSALTISKIRAECEKRRLLGKKIGLIIVDYINKVTLTDSIGLFDWKEQVSISAMLKKLGLDFDTPVLSPYQIDNTGEARFAKGILDAADCSMTIERVPHTQGIMPFKITKMRNDSDEFEIVSVMNWASLKIGPEPGERPVTEEKPKKGFGAAKQIPEGNAIWD